MAISWSTSTSFEFNGWHPSKTENSQWERNLIKQDILKEFVETRKKFLPEWMREQRKIWVALNAVWESLKVDKIKNDTVRAIYLRIQLEQEEDDSVINATNLMGDIGWIFEQCFFEAVVAELLEKNAQWKFSPQEKIIIQWIVLTDSYPENLDIDRMEKIQWIAGQIRSELSAHYKDSNAFWRLITTARKHVIEIFELNKEPLRVWVAQVLQLIKDIAFKCKKYLPVVTKRSNV